MALVDCKNQKITSETQLRKIISAYPKILDKRVRFELDHYCREFISFSTLIVSAYHLSNYPMVPLTHKDVVVLDSKTIMLSLDSFLNLGDASIYASLYFLVPGVGHGLRVNGQFEKQKDSKVVFKVTTAYLHCARAAARAELWRDHQSKSQFENNKKISPEEFISASPYLLMKTTNEMGETELSPRGDQAGFVHLIEEDCLFIPERPGNKVAVSLRNILKNGKVELLFFLPGTDYIMNVNGHAILTEDEQYIDATAVNNKRPKLGILLEKCCFSIAQSKAIKSAQPWFDKSHVNPDCLTRFSKALSAHMNGEGLIGKAATPFISAIVKNDMKHLY